jgi:hypothetical protein
MAMGHAAARITEISRDNLYKLCRTTLRAFEQELAAQHLTLNDFGRAIQLSDWAAIMPPRPLQRRRRVNKSNDYDEQVAAPVDEATWSATSLGVAWAALREKFAAVTAVGASRLALDVFTHDSEADGDRYDEIDGTVYEVSGVYTRTPAAKKISDMLEDRAFVQFG